jgi:hypothetical protein
VPDGATALSCPIADFSSWLYQIGEAFPVEEARFATMIAKWVQTSDSGQSHFVNGNIGISAG